VYLPRALLSAPVPNTGKWTHRHWQSSSGLLPLLLNKHTKTWIILMTCTSKSKRAPTVFDYTLRNRQGQECPTPSATCSSLTEAYGWTSLRLVWFGGRQTGHPKVLTLASPFFHSSSTTTLHMYWYTLIGQRSRPARHIRFQSITSTFTRMGTASELQPLAKID
jgi:hypothetical protein